MKTPNDTSVRTRLRNVVALLAVVALIALGVLFVRALGPSSAVVEQRAADRAAWEKSQTAEQRAASEAWHEAVRESQRHRGLIALVFLIGNIIVVATCIRSTRANARDLGTRQIRFGTAFLKVLSRTSVGVGAACAFMIVVPVVESVLVGGHGMYSGEQMLAALFTTISFLFLWVFSLAFAAIVLWRRSRAHEAPPGRSAQ
jgi:hypothetical protein